MEKQFFNLEFYYKTDKKEAKETIPEVVEKTTQARFNIGRLKFYLSVTEGEGKAKIVPTDNYTKEVFLECSK